MIEIAIVNLAKSFGDNLVLRKISFEIQKGDRVGLIGRNGSGKTTLFRIIAGLEEYDAGNVYVKNDTSIGYLEQIPLFEKDKTVLDVLKLSFLEVKKLKKKIESLEIKMHDQNGNDLRKLMRKYQKLQTKFEIKDGYKIDVKLNKICSGLKILPTMQQMKFERLSGGEKTTVMLAQMLLQNPDILLLDEPTNHLDIDAVEWLEDFLADYKGTIFMISHDRYFLDRLVNKIIELEDRKTISLSGNYSNYIQEKEKRIEIQFKQFKNQQKKIKKMKEAIQRFRDWGKRADNPAMFKKAFNIERHLEKMEKIDKPTQAKKINLDFLTRHRSGNDVLAIQDLGKSFNNKTILNNLNFSLFYSERVAMLGKNGSGKTTIFKIILDEISPNSGKIKIGARVKIGYLEQEVKFDEENISLLDFYRNTFPVSETEARNHLAGFLFFGNQVFKKISVLSGGEKVRLKLCTMMHKNLNLLLLDEPTNHLDIDSIEIFEDSLSKFKGTILFISHDRYFINKIAEKIVELKNKKFKTYLGNYNFYKEKKKNEDKKNLGKPADKPEKIDKSKEYQKKKKKSNREKSRKRRISQIEIEIAYLEKELDKKKEDSEIYATDYEKLEEIYNERNILKKKIEDLMGEWEKLEMINQFRS